MDAARGRASAAEEELAAFLESLKGWKERVDKLDFKKIAARYKNDKDKSNGRFVEKVKNAQIKLKAAMESYEQYVKSKKVDMLKKKKKRMRKEGFRLQEAERCVVKALELLESGSWDWQDVSSTFEQMEK